jgi:hypothetical protein
MCNIITGSKHVSLGLQSTYSVITILLGGAEVPVSIERAMGWMTVFRFPRGTMKELLFTTASRPSLQSTQSPIQWVPGNLSLGQSGRGVKLTIYLHLAPRSRMYGTIPPLPQYVFIALCLVKHRDDFTFTLPVIPFIM